MEVKKIFVSTDCVFAGTRDYREQVIASIRSAYKKGDNLNEQEFLNSIDWYKKYKNICFWNTFNNMDSLNAIRAYREFVVVVKTLCDREKEAWKAILEKYGYEGEPYTIPIKKEGQEIIDESKEEQHFGDIMSEGFAITGNTLVDMHLSELQSWTLRGGKSLFFDPMGDESDYQVGDEDSVVYTVNRLTKVPKLIGISKK
ncbi:MAG: hypothetical protein IKZ96_03870 [Bacilli bacterium]|nr:hypothetical protein [Bacilli bacterium]